MVYSTSSIELTMKTHNIKLGILLYSRSRETRILAPVFLKQASSRHVVDNPGVTEMLNSF